MKVLGFIKLPRLEKRKLVDINVLLQAGVVVWGDARECSGLDYREELWVHRGEGRGVLCGEEVEVLWRHFWCG